ncbi:P2 family phage major capsid protein [uncultured Ruminococcus sp.]|uniref:P2 family phage major capsid protein n=1 Tax=uncultured Ruminococcus sp. TaxID=165186 RepID=UPI00265CD628|nr:P2 family phage major capsid protein [uncultured Ruminococcus sp.]
MPKATRQLLKDTTPIKTSDITNGLLNPEQAKKFLQQTFDATHLGSLVRHEMKTAKSGEVDKIGIAKRIIREKTENVDDGYRGNVKTSVVKYACTAVRLPWEITEETLRENIEGQNFEKIVTDLMTTQLGIDLIDLYLNGDESTESGDPDYDFLKINDGWVKQIENGGNIVDNANAALSLDMFYKMLQAVPDKYNNGKLRWLMSPHMKQNWERVLYNAAKANGSTLPEKFYEAPAGVPIETETMFPESKIMLTDPKNLIVTNTYTMQIRKTTEGKEAIMQDKRFYVIHLDFDTIIEELEATGMITNIKANL